MRRILQAMAVCIVSTPDDVRRVIAYWADEGATWFKFQGGVTRGVLRAGIEEAHRRGLHVTGHLCSVTFTEAAALGIDALQHGFITNSDYVPTKEPDVCPPENMRIQADVDVASAEVQESIRRIVAGGAAVVSTLGVCETFVPGRARLDPRAMALLTPDARAEVAANHAALAETPFVVPERLLRKMMQWERDFVAAGGLLGAGADPWGTGYLPGFGGPGWPMAPGRSVAPGRVDGARAGRCRPGGSIPPDRVDTARPRRYRQTASIPPSRVIAARPERRGPRPCAAPTETRAAILPPHRAQPQEERDLAIGASLRLRSRTRRRFLVRRKLPHTIDQQSGRRSRCRSSCRACARPR